MRTCPSVALVLLATCWATPPEPTGAGPSAGFDAPETILDGSRVGRYLFPTFADLDGDGADDLLVGVPGRLLIYRNRGTDARPAYEAPAWFDEAVPSARIPDG